MHRRSLPRIFYLRPLAGFLLVLKSRILHGSVVSSAVVLCQQNLLMRHPVSCRLGWPRGATYRLIPLYERKPTIMKTLLWIHFGLQRELDIKAAYKLKKEYGLIWDRSTPIQQVLRRHRELTPHARKQRRGRSNGYL